MPWVIFGIALAVRGLHIWQLRDSPFFSTLIGDSRAYDEWAIRLAAGDWVGRDVFYQAPLYPYFLGTVYALVGRDLLLVRLAQALLGAASAALVAAGAARFFSPRAGLIAGLLMAFYAPAVFFSALIQKAVLDVFLMSLAIWAVARLQDSPNVRQTWFVLGAALALLSLTRENALLLLPVALLFVRRHTVVAFAAGVLIVLAPVVARNQVVGGGWYLTTSQLGPNLYIGNNPRADGTYQPLREGRGDAAFERQDAIAVAESALGRALTPGEVSAYWRRQALSYITSSPLQWLRLMARKLRLLVSATELPDTEAQESHADASQVLRVLQPFGHFGVGLPLALLGVALTWPDRRRLALLYALALTYASSVLAFFVLARYRYPLVPFVLMFAGAGLAALPRFVREASALRRLSWAVAVAGVAYISSLPVLASDVMRAITVTNLGAALQAQGRLDEAEAQYRQAIAIRPDYAPAYNNLGVVLQRHGRTDDAIAAFRRALAYHPDDAGTHMNLGEALLRQGRHLEAVAHYRRRAELDPSDLARRYDLGNVLLEARDVAAAEIEFRRLTELAPDAAQAHNRLGIALAAQGRFDEAITAFQRALTLRPDFPEAQQMLEQAQAARRQ
jgi:tetratricopeptide (TPR) repeat protein